MADPAHDFPSHASPHLGPLHSPIPRPSSQYLHGFNWNDLERSSGPSTPGIPENLISPAFTPPLTPTIPSTPHDDDHHRQLHVEPKSTPVDTSKDDPATTKQPRLVKELPVVECVVRARIPTTSGAEMFLHLYQNDTDNKEHLAIVFGNSIRSRSLDAEKSGETEMDRMIRGAYIGRLRPGRMSSRIDDSGPRRRKSTKSKPHSGSALKNVTTIPQDAPVDTAETTTTSQTQTDPISTTTTETSISEQSAVPIPTSTPIPPTPLPQNLIDPTSHIHHFVKPPLVRIHSECYTGETAWSARCDCGEQLDEAARLMSLPSTIAQSGGGVIVYLRQEGRGIGLASKLKAYNLQDLGNDTVEANLLLRHPADARSYGLATAILADLGLGTDTDSDKADAEKGIRLLTNNPDKVRAVEGPAREVRVVERVAMVPLAWSSKGNKGVKGAEIEKYLETKIGRMGHMLER